MKKIKEEKGTDHKVNKTATIPAKDADFCNVVKSISNKWNDTEWFSVRWTTSTEFAAKVSSYETILYDRLQTGSSRPQLTKGLKVLEKKTDDSLTYVKGYILEKYKRENAKSYYRAFGIELLNKTYAFPKDQNARLNALDLMVNAIADNGFADKDYGTIFWTNLKTDYENLLTLANEKDSLVSEKVSIKRMLRKDLEKTLNAIIYILKGHYPDTFKSELRNWGFQKEKY